RSSSILAAAGVLLMIGGGGDLGRNSKGGENREKAVKPRFYSRMVASEAVLSGGAGFQAETEDLWTIGNLSHFPVDLRLRITNRSDKDLMFPFFDTFVPIIVDPDGKEKELLGERTFTKPVMRPLLLHPGQDYTVVREAHLREGRLQLR